MKTLLADRAGLADDFFNQEFADDVNREFNRRVFAFAIFCEFKQFLINVLEVGVRAGIKRPAGNAIAATVGEVALFPRDFCTATASQIPVRL